MASSTEISIAAPKSMKPTKFPAKTPVPAAVAVAFTVLAVLSGLHAQTAWDGGASTTDYATALNWAGDVIPGNGNNNGVLIGNGSNQTVIYDTATSYTSTGTGKANSLLVGTGTGGIGSLTLSGSAGTLTFGGDGYNNAAWIGTNNSTTASATGTVTVSAGKLAIGTGAGSDASINLGVRASGSMTSGVRSGTLVINGGTVEVGRRILMGANDNSCIGLLTLSSGTLEMKRTGSSAEGDLGMIRIGSGTNTVNLDGGLAIMSAFRVSEASNARSTIYFNGTTLRANVATTDFLTANGSTANVNLRLKTGGLVMDTNGFAITIADALTQESGHTAILRKEGSGTLTLSGTSNHTGATTVNGGILKAGVSGAFGSNSAVTLANTAGVALDITGFNTQIGSLTGGGTTGGNVTLGAATLTIGGDNTSPAAYAGQISGTGGITKTGNGVLTLSGTNNYTGATAVNVGTLLINGSISTSSLTTVASGATLGGTGTVGATVVNGTLAAGNSPGTMNFTSTLSLAGNVISEIDGNAGAGVTGGHDFINLTGAGAAGVLTYGGTLTLDIGTVFGAGNYSWNLFDMASETGTFSAITLTDQYTGNLLDGNSDGIWDLTSGSNTWQFNESTGILGLTVIPEPTTALLGMIGLLAILRRRR